MRPLFVGGVGLLAGVLVSGCAGSAGPAPKASERKPEVAAAPVAAPAPVAPVAPVEAPVVEITGGLSTPPDAAVEVAAPAPAVLGSCDLRATVKVSDGPERSKRYTLTLKNMGTRSLSLVIPGDGSEVGWRAPVIEWSATSGGRPVEQLESPGCGMMNAIQADEIFTLAPGASKAMTDWIHGPTYAPGTYEVRLRYINDPKRAFGKVTATPEVKQLLAASSACDVTSEPMKLKVQ